ncbi:hypothetical protein ACQ1PL_04365 [Ornithobacterium rhinotracheale]
MNCYNHPLNSAVATCVDCGKGLCVECSDMYTIPICSTCNGHRISNEKKQISNEFLLMAAVGGLFFLIYRGLETPLAFKITTIYAGASLVAGWRFLNRITPQMFLFLPLIGWLFYFLVKGVVAGFVGFFYLPFRVFRNIKRLRELNQIPN